MSIQLLITDLLVALAILFVFRSTYRTWFSPTKSGCSSGCGKCPAATNAAEAPSPTQRITLPLLK